MQVANNDIYITRGDTAYLYITAGNYTFSDGDVVDFTVRKDYETDVVLHKRVEQFTDYVGEIKLDTNDTAGLEFGEYLYDVQITFSNGDVCTVITPHKFIVGKEITYGELV